MYAKEKLTADEYRALSKQSHQDAIDSFDRSDTDGALSQWASNISSMKYSKLAYLAENNWKDTFETLVDLNGNLVPCRLIQTKYGFSFGVYASFEDAQECGNIIEWVGTGHRAAKNKGYQIAVVESEATVEIKGSGWSVGPCIVSESKVFTNDNCTIIKVGA